MYSKIYKYLLVFLLSGSYCKSIASLNGGVIGQPVVFQHGLSDATYPDTPDWSQNYAINFTQPLYQGGKIRYAIHKADLKKRDSLSSDRNRPC